MANTLEIRATQSYVLTAITLTDAAGVRATQTFGLVAASSGTPARVAQTAILVAIKTGSEERELRAWTFTQDDHDFYVLNLGSSTIVYDKLTEQWCEWNSPGDAYWRGNDGCDWAGINVCCDPETGQIYQIDPDNRLDYGTTPIVSQIFGGMTERFRTHVPCYMAELAVSEGRPPAGVDASTLSIQLRTYDTLNWIDHGTITANPTDEMTYFRWYGLGLMKSPGVMFEITDTGYARRIDGLNVEVRGEPDNG